MDRYGSGYSMDRTGPTIQTTRNDLSITNGSSNSQCSQYTEDDSAVTANNNWQITSHTQSGPATGTTVRKSKSKSKTVNQKPTVHSQRSEWAHAHFIIHHGTNADTAQFLTHPRNVKNTPVDALKEIRVMSVERVPT